MKKKVKPIFLTLFILVGITAVGYYFLTSRQAGPTGEFRGRIEEEQKDLGDNRAYQYDLGQKAIPLATTGEQKNVLNFEHEVVYDVQQSNADRERLDRLIKRSDADFENPIIALNPFGTNENSFYFYFSTSYRCMIRYTITVEDETIHDHVRYVNNGQENNMSKTHEFVLSGLVPGKTNYIILDLLDSTGAKRESKTYQFTAAKGSAPERIAVEQGYSKDVSNTGMFFVFPKQGKQILTYDNQGILRNVTNTESAHGKRIYQIGDSVLYQVADNKVARVSSLGRVLGVAKIDGYGAIKDFCYDGFNEVYSLANKKKQNYLLATSMETGKTRVVYRFSKGVSVGSLSTPQGGQMLMTAAKPSGLICMNAITSSNPQISWVMGRKSDWKKLVGKKKIVQDKEIITWNTSQSQISTVDNNTFSLLVEKEGKATGICGQADTKVKSWKVLMKRAFGGNTANLFQVQGEHMILTDVTEGNYAEYDSEGKVTRKFGYGSPVDSVVKLTLEDMCFYGI